MTLEDARECASYLESQGCDHVEVRDIHANPLKPLFDVVVFVGNDDESPGAPDWKPVFSVQQWTNLEKPGG